MRETLNGWKNRLISSILRRKPLREVWSFKTN